MTVMVKGLSTGNVLIDGDVRHNLYNERFLGLDMTSRLIGAGPLQPPV